MKRLAVLAAVVLAILLVADRLALAYVEDQIGDAIVEKSDGLVGDADASLSSFPFVGRLAFFGQVSHLELRLRDLAVDSVLPVDELRVEIDDLRMDRGSLIDENRVHIRSVDRVTASAVVSEESLESAVGDVVDIELDRGTATVGGVSVDVAIVDGRLTVDSALGDLDVPVTLADLGLLPCDPALEIGDDELVLSCTSDRLPQIVIDAIGTVDLRDAD